MKVVGNRLIIGDRNTNQLYLEYSKFETGDTIHIKFSQGTGRYFYKEDIHQLLDYLMNIYQGMK